MAAASDHPSVTDVEKCLELVQEARGKEDAYGLGHSNSTPS